MVKGKNARRRETERAHPGKTIKNFHVVASVQTDAGCVRETNEDNVRFIKPNDPQLIAEKGMLTLVCDGMGGHSAGEVASRMAVDLISSLYYQSPQETQTALRFALEEANRQIYAVSQTDETKRGMGTTCTALVVREGCAYAAHVGDSRMYLVRDGAAHLLTQDHSMVMELVKRGVLTMEEARHHEDKNVITRALGTQSEIEVDMWEKSLPVKANDTFLLCSDGLYDLIEDGEIGEAVISSKDAYEACEALISLAKERGGYDNITVCIVQIKPLGENEASLPSLPVTRELEVSL